MTNFESTSKNPQYYWYLITDCANLGSKKKKVNGVTMRNVYIGHGLSYKRIFAALLFGFTGPRYPNAPKHYDDTSSDEETDSNENYEDCEPSCHLREFARYPNFTTDPKFAKYYELAKLDSPQFFQNPSNLERYWKIEWPCSMVNWTVVVASAWQEPPDNIITKKSDKPKPENFSCKCGNVDCNGTEIEIVDRWEQHPPFEKDLVYKMFLEKDQDITKLLETIPLNQIVMTKYRGNQTCCDLCIYKTDQELEELWVTKKEFEIIFS